MLHYFLSTFQALGITTYENLHTSMIGSSHTNRLSALVPAGLETEYVKLPSQSQTNVEQRIEQLAIALASLELTPGDFVYI